MKAIDLFCGTGGFSLGAVDAGFDVVAAFDIDKNLTFSHRENFPDTHLELGDIAELQGKQISDRFGSEIALVFGGPPCQGFSMMGRRDAADPRRSLLADFFRVVSEVKPVVFVMENVEGLLVGEARQVLDDALTFVDGYKVLDPLILDASEFGAATKRRRAFVIGYDPSRSRPIEPQMFTPVSTDRHTVSDALSGLETAMPADNLRNGFDLRRMCGKAELSAYASRLASEDYTFTGDQRTKHSGPVIKRFAEVQQGSSDPIGKHPRLHPDRFCPTLRAGTGSEKGSFQSVRPIHPTENRVITVREAARLQGFPDRHLFHPTIWHSFRQIGNSVSPIISAQILSTIADALNE